MSNVPPQLHNIPKSDWCAYAAKHGNLELLQWVRANGAPWGEYTCWYAAFKGHVEILKWARSHGAPWDEGTCWYAAFKCHTECLQWALTHGAQWSHDSIQPYEKELQTPTFRGVAICLMKLKRGTPKTDLVIIKFIHKLYDVLPLIAPLCDVIINYC